MVALAALIVLLLMVAFDLGLHVHEVWSSKPLPLFRNRNQYAGFWIAYWAIASSIAALGIGAQL